MPAYPVVLEGNVIVRHGGLFMPGEGTIKAPKGDDVASAGELKPGSGCLFDVTGVVEITSIVATAAEGGRVIVLQFDGTCQITDGNNLKLAGNFAAQASGMIGLCCFDGTNWTELFRSSNWT